MRIYWIACMQAVDLRSSKILSPSKAKSRSSVYETALPEILHVLRTAYDKHNLPLAQTRAPCIQHGKGGCWHPTNHAQCVSTVDSACYVRGPRVQEFHEACSEHHLLRGQGVVGEAFMTNHPRVATDVTAFTKAEYSLSHLDKLFGPVLNANEPEKHAFHIMTDKLNFAPMKMWFIVHPPANATVEVMNVDGLKWPNSCWVWSLPCG